MYRIFAIWNVESGVIVEPSLSRRGNTVFCTALFGKY